MSSSIHSESSNLRFHVTITSPPSLLHRICISNSMEKGWGMWRYPVFTHILPFSHRLIQCLEDERSKRESQKHLLTKMGKRTVFSLIRCDCCPVMEKAMAAHSSTLAWKIPWTEEPGGLQSLGSLRVGHDWVTSLWLFTCMHWRRKWQPTPVFLPRDSQGWGSLVGCRLWGRTESDTTEVP